MLTIDWHIEALAFCKANNICPQDTTLATVELAMRQGALIITDQISRAIKIENDVLEKKRKLSMPQHDTKTIPL
jgi:hypothetical protein